MNLPFFLRDQYNEIKEIYPGLYPPINISDFWVISGLLDFTAKYQGISIKDKYQIEILIPITNPLHIPFAREIGGRIPMDFHHSTEGLCLGEPGRVIQKFNEEPTLLGFINNCLIPYLYNFSYKEKFGYLIFGELSHGTTGLLEYYQELFGIKDRKRILQLLGLCINSHLNGQIRCPCGSKKKLRKCHGILLNGLISGVPREIIKAEYDLINNGNKSHKFSPR